MTYEEYRAFQCEKQIKIMMQHLVVEDPLDQDEYLKSVMCFAKEYRRDSYRQSRQKLPQPAA